MRRFCEWRSPISICLHFTLLKFIEIEGCFPSPPREVPAAALSHLASQVRITPTAFVRYDWTDGTGKRHRGSIRALLGFRPFSVGDVEPLRDWLCRDVLPSEHNPQHLGKGVLAGCWERHIEPPSNQRFDRIVRSAVRTHESRFFEVTCRQLSPETRTRLDALLLPTGPEEPISAYEAAQEVGDFTAVSTPFSVLKTDPGAISLASVLKELDKLKRLSTLALPADLFTGVPSKVLQTYRLRAAAEPPREMGMHPEAIRYTLLGAFCWQRVGRRSSMAWSSLPDPGGSPHLGQHRQRLGKRGHLPERAAVSRCRAPASGPDGGCRKAPARHRPRPAP